MGVLYRLGLPVLDFKISWECFELNQRRENITKWTTPPPLCVVPIDRKETLHHYQKVCVFMCILLYENVCVSLCIDF